MRAIAVLGVVAYHFDLRFVTGGFVGVDVFFVISGFLMTEIIARRLADNRFAFASFYGARVRRIVPALVVLVAVVTTAGCLALAPLKLELLGQDAVASLLFVSNITYLGQGGYFAPAANQNWLLHTWSLSVEWQFYILFPVLLWGLHRLGRGVRTTVAVLALIAVLSFAATVRSSYAGGGTLMAAFYMTHTRVWEFLVGALASYGARHRGLSAGARATLHILGVGVVLASLFLLQSHTAVWPSAWAAAPVLGTAIVLVSDWRASRWPAFPAVAAIGRWSYSIYLWHWPTAAIAAFFNVWSLGVRLSLVLLSLALGALSYRLVEQRLTDALTSAPRRRWLVGLPTFGVVLAFAGAAQATHGFESVRFGSRPDLLAASRDYRAAEDDWIDQPSQACDAYQRVSSVFSVCRVGNPAAQDTLVIGDSFALQLVPRYHDSQARASFGMTFLTRSGCMPSPAFDRIPLGFNCAAWSEAAYAFARQAKYKRIVITAFWSSYNRTSACLLDVPDCGAKLDAKGFEAALDGAYLKMAEAWRALRAQGKTVVVMEEPPFGLGDPSDLYDQALRGTLVKTLTMPLVDFEKSRSPAMARVAAAATAAGATLVNPATDLCPGGECPFVENGRALYRDGYHLRASQMKSRRLIVFDRYLLPNTGISSR